MYLDVKLNLVNEGQLNLTRSFSNYMIFFHKPSSTSRLKFHSFLLIENPSWNIEKITVQASGKMKKQYANLIHYYQYFLTRWETLFWGYILV